MLWTSPAIVLSMRPFGEGKAIASVLTEDHGRYCGLVPGGGGKRLSLLQPGGLVSATWRARVAEQLGLFTVEPLRGLDARIIHDRLRLAALTAACSLLDTGLPEREPNSALYRHTLGLLQTLGDETGDDEACVAAYACWERLLVAALGFGLPWTGDAATPVLADNAYIAAGKEGNMQSGGRRDEAVAVQLHRTLAALEEHVYASGRQSVPLARSRLAELIARDRR